MFKKLLLAVILTIGSSEIYADSSIIQCDPNATGNTSYPNVSCTSNGYINVNSTYTPSGTQNVAVTSSLPGGTNSIGRVTIFPYNGTFTDGSGTITTGGTSQQIFGTNGSRAYLLIQNLSTGNLYINFTSAASAGSGSILLLPNSSYVMESSMTSTEAVNIYGATTGQAFTAKQK
jgi:hypothetical protein